MRYLQVFLKVPGKIPDSAAHNRRYLMQIFNDVRS
jgi:hypothetical protein